MAHILNGKAISSEQGPKPVPLDAGVDGGDGGEGVEAELEVILAAHQVVEDANLIPPRAQVQRRRPAAVPVPAWRELFI